MSNESDPEPIPIGGIIKCDETYLGKAAMMTTKQIIEAYESGDIEEANRLSENFDFNITEELVTVILKSWLPALSLPKTEIIKTIEDFDSRQKLGNKDYQLWKIIKLYLFRYANQKEPEGCISRPPEVVQNSESIFSKISRLIFSSSS